MGERVADLVVRGLKAHGVERLYCVPGESYLALLDALHDANTIQTIACRHESGAGFMAVAEAKITGQPAVCAVSRGPGATNASIAVHVAEQDAVPLIMLIGQVSRLERARNAFQEIDYSHFFGSIAKGVFEPHDASKVPETLTRAFRLARGGVPGPVIISLPEDVLGEYTDVAMPAPYPVVTPGIGADDIERIGDLLAVSKRPLVIAGGALRGARGAASLKAFAERHHVPVATGWKHQDVFDNTSPLYAGHLGFGNPAAHKQTLADTDLIIAAGTRLGDIVTQHFTFPNAPEPRQPLVHIHASETPIGRVFRTDLGVVADPAAVLDALSTLPGAHLRDRQVWAGKINTYIDGFMHFHGANPADGVDFGQVIMAAAKAAPDDAVVITDAGNFSSWVHRHWRLTPKNRLIGCVGGAMGFGVPASVAASLIEPRRAVIAIVGDGGMLMTGQELATAVMTGAKPKVFISDNGIYGTIRSHQEMRFPGRVSATDLANPDFTAWARAFGVRTVTITAKDDIAGCVEEALNHDGACVIHVHSSREALSAFATISDLRA